MLPLSPTPHNYIGGSEQKSWMSIAIVASAFEARIRELRANGSDVLKIAKTVCVGTSVVQRVVSQTI